MKRTKSLVGVSILALAGAAGLTTAAVAAGPVMVTNGNDSGEGSLRAALDVVAQQDAAGQILVVTDGNISIDSTLIYSGQAPLAIYGNGQTVTTDVNQTLLTASDGATLKIEVGGKTKTNKLTYTSASGKTCGPLTEGSSTMIANEFQSFQTLKVDGETKFPIFRTKVCHHRYCNHWP